MNKIVRIILLVLGAALIALSVKGLTDIPRQKAVLEQAVYLEEPVVLPENEGKLVILHGVPELLSPVYDEELKLTLQTIKAYRYREVYKQTSASSKDKKWEWVPSGQTTLVGEAKLGEFELDEALLTAFPAEGHYEDFDPAETAEYSLYYPSIGSQQLYVLPEGGYYADAKTTSTDEAQRDQRAARELASLTEGQSAYYYRFYPLDGGEEMTVAGVQQGNRLVKDETVGAIVRTGVATREKVLSSNSTSLAAGSAVFLVLGALLILLALCKAKKTA